MSCTCVKPPECSAMRGWLWSMNSSLEVRSITQVVMHHLLLSWSHTTVVSQLTVGRMVVVLNAWIPLLSSQIKAWISTFCLSIWIANSEFCCMQYNQVFKCTRDPELRVVASASTCGLDCLIRVPSKCSKRRSISRESLNWRRVAGDSRTSAD